MQFEETRRLEHEAQRKIVDRVNEVIVNTRMMGSDAQIKNVVEFIINEIVSEIIAKNPGYVYLNDHSIALDKGSLDIRFGSLLSHLEWLEHAEQEKQQKARINALIKKQAAAEQAYRRRMKNMLRKLAKLERLNEERIPKHLKEIWRTFNNQQRLVILKDIDYRRRHEVA